VRRWDGYAILTRSGAAWSVKSVSGTLQAKDRGRVFVPLSGGTPTHGHFTIGAQLVAYLSGLKLTLDLNGKKFVAGDFWLATVREDAEDAARVQQTQATPVGIEHRYVALARANGAAVVPFSDAETRRLSFPRLTDLSADHVGYDPAPKAARWTDVIDDAATPLPLNVQTAIDTLLDKLESSDISYTLPGCTGNTLRQLLLSAAPASQKINELLDTLLCGIDSGNVPYTVGSAPGTTVKSVLDAINVELPKKVSKAGDTMTGALVIDPAPAVPTSLDIKGTLQTEQLKLIAPAGTPNKAVLTYESVTGFAKWLETSLTAWQLAGGNLSTDTTAVTGSVTIGRPTTIEGNLQVNGALTGAAAAAFAPASHDHDSRYLSLIFNNSADYAPGQERTMTTTFADRPGIVTFAYMTFDAGGVLQTGTTFVNGPLSGNIEVKVLKIAGSGGAFDKDYRVVVRNASTARLFISVEVFE